MSWLSKLFKNVSIRDAERAVKKLLRDEPWLKEALRELAEAELLRLHERVVAEINERHPIQPGAPITWTSPTGSTIFTVYAQSDKPTIYGGDQ